MTQLNLGVRIRLAGGQSLFGELVSWLPTKFDEKWCSVGGVAVRKGGWRGQGPLMERL